MPVIKIITIINWVLIGVFGAYVLWGFMNRTGHSDAAGQGLESAFIGLCFFILLVLIGLNILSYSWTKIVALLIVSLLLWAIYTHE